jgi:hypothetical protein
MEVLADLLEPSPLFDLPEAGRSFRGRPSSRRHQLVHRKRRGQGTEMLAELGGLARIAQLVFRSALTGEAAPCATPLLFQ